MTQPQLSTALVLRSEVVRLGGSDGELRRMVTARQIQRLRRGSYMSVVDYAALNAEQQHAADVEAALVAQQRGSVVSHQSAAVLHGLPIWPSVFGVVHLNKERRNAGRRNGLLHIHTAPMDEGDVVEIAGALVTSATRTVFDLCTQLPFEQAVIVADAALFKRLTSKDALAEMAERSRGRHGHERAVRAITFADDRSESVGESRSRVGMHLAKLPVPILQHVVLRENGSVVGRSDFDWDWLLGEFDGLIKYDRLRRPGESPGDVVAREKRREEELQDYGYDMTRWTWRDLDPQTGVWDRVGAKIARTESRRGRRL
jgi:hypothetical protein